MPTDLINFISRRTFVSLMTLAAALALLGAAGCGDSRPGAPRGASGGIFGGGGGGRAVPQTGGTQDLSLRHALQEAGLAPKEKGGTVDVVQYAPADVETRLQSKELDAAWLPEPWVSRLEKGGLATLLIDERTLWPGKR